MSTHPTYDRILASIDDETVKTVYCVIRDHHGKEHAITKEAVSLVIWGKYNPSTDRTIRECVETLHEIYSVPVCSNSGKAGYYMPATRAELDEYLSEMRSRRNKLDLTIRKLEYAAKTWDYSKPKEHLPAPFEAVQMPLIPEQKVYA